MHPTSTRSQVCTHVRVQRWPPSFDPKASASDPASVAPYGPQPEVRPAKFSAVATSTADFGVNPFSARPGSLQPEFTARQRYTPQQGHARTVSMAQATSPSMSLQDGHQNNHHNTPHVKSNPEVPIDPSIAASSPTYPTPYSPYAQQGHEMAQYPGHPPPGYQHWPQQYAGHPHGLPNGPYSSPGTAVSAAGAAATAGPRPGQVGDFFFLFKTLVPVPFGSANRRRTLTLSPRCIPSCLSQARSNTSGPVVAMKKSSGCISVDGKAAKRRMAR